MTERPPRARQPSSGAPGSDEQIDAHSKPDFDPYKFSKVTVPPELRRQMVQAQLPRLEAEFFHDTLPPHHRALLSGEPSPESPRPDSFDDLPPRRRPIKLVLACLLGALSLLMLGLFKSGFLEKASGPSASALVTPPAPSPREAVVATPQTTTLSAALPASAARTADRPAAPAPMNSAKGNVSKAQLAPAEKSPPRVSGALGSTPARPPNRDLAAASELPGATPTPSLVATDAVPAGPSPSAPVAPKPVQTSWFSPK
ncbi:MAG TPA: hypothetical protein VHM25_22165 [Polyangiaceae bacterium]|jgi:hypothetical protein|nr:hypothetical protein [Polyangiaceae bacterium]